MWRALRIAALLVILASVAQTAWLARTRTAEWQRSLRVAIYPIAADSSATTAAYISSLEKSLFEPIEAFFESEREKYALALSTPVDVSLAEPIASEPPAPPFGGNALQVIAWSLRLRYWAWRHDRYEGPKPDVRIFVLYHDPGLRSQVPHSTGLQKGFIGVVNAFALSSMNGSNNVVITHELLHTLGATDKYDPRDNRPLFPDGYADPEAVPRYPQRRAEIMAGRIPLSETRLAMPTSMRQVVIGPATAREINWIRIR